MKLELSPDGHKRADTVNPNYSTSCPLLLDCLGLGPNDSSIRQVEQGSDDPCQIEDRKDVRVMENLP